MAAAHHHHHHHPQHPHSHVIGSCFSFCVLIILSLPLIRARWMSATKCLGKLLIFCDDFLSALCSALAVCEVPFPRLCFPLASGFVLTFLMPPPPAALPLHSSSREQTHLESCTSFASVRWHVCPRVVDSRFVTLTSRNPTRDSSTLSHIPQKRLMQGLRSETSVFHHLVFLEVQSIQVLLFGSHCLILLRSQILHDRHEKNHHTAPQCNSRSSFSATPGVVLKTKGIEKVKLPEFQSTTPGVFRNQLPEFQKSTPGI